MIPPAHVGGVPLEELLPALAGPAGALLFARAWLSLHLRRRTAVELVAAIGTKPLPREPER